MTDELLALLEAGPQTIAQLAADLGQTEALVHTWLKALAREGLVVKIDGRWAIAGTVEAPAPAPAKPQKPKQTEVTCDSCGTAFLTNIGATLCRPCRRSSAAATPVLAYVEPSRFQPDQTPVSDTRTIVVDGIEYTAISVGSRPVTRDWPESKGGSSLAELGFSIDRS